ncbi:hypothetical protein ACFRJ9_15445 [Paenarthrobacter sp. NPDC056912]|uniref:hypothetical protein n=1 Tax=Paenarthrobacter sp. NPDC056912 TaxID=3345965 RepID=UPI00366A7C9E
MNADIRATAATLGFSDPQDAIALFGDISTVEITDDGPDAKAIKARLDEIAKDKPYLLKSTTGPKVVTKPKPVKGEESDADNKPGKSKAAAAQWGGYASERWRHPRDQRLHDQQDGSLRHQRHHEPEEGCHRGGADL